MSSPINRDILNKTKLDFYKQIKLYQASLKPTKEIEGVGSAPIVGEQNYPYLKVHNISTEEKTNSFVNAGDVVKKEYNDIIKLKAKNILGSTDRSYIKQNHEKINSEIIDIYKSKKVIEFSSEFEKELKFNKVMTDKVAGVMGAKNPLKKIEATENTSTSKQIEKYIAEDIKAREAMISLYEKGTPEHQIIHLLALGTFGLEINKKLVPTRWAISAYDQTIEKHIHKKIINNKPINNYEVYFTKNKSDTHVYILIPDTFSGEHVEDWEAKVVGKDYISYDNKLKKESPDNGGGYYATKIAVLEHMQKRKVQASFVTVRVIRNYDLALGVVFVRECARDALKNKIFETSDKSELETFLKTKYPLHYKHFMESTVIKESKKQTKLNNFF